MQQSDLREEKKPFQHEDRLHSKSVGPRLKTWYENGYISGVRSRSERPHRNKHIQEGRHTTGYQRWGSKLPSPTSWLNSLIDR